MPFTPKGIPGSSLRDGTLTPRELALVDWVFTAPITNGILTGPPTAATGSMTIDGTPYTISMTITRDVNGIPTSVTVVYPGIDGEPNATVTYTPVYDNSGNLIGENTEVTA